MELCEKCDIVYNEYQCPLCEANEQIERLNSMIDDLDSENSALEDKIDKLEKEIENK